MPYDPNFPASHTELTSDAYRNQFNGLRTLIDNVPAGPPGEKGDRGVGIQSIQDTGGAVLITTEDNSGWGPFPLPAGPQGSQGIAGNDGGPGPQGPPGDVSTQQMNDAIGTAIAGTSNNTNTIQLLTLTVSDPPTQGEVQAIQDKLNELIMALRRNV